MGSNGSKTVSRKPNTQETKAVTGFPGWQLQPKTSIRVFCERERERERRSVLERVREEGERGEKVFESV